MYQWCSVQAIRLISNTYDKMGSKKHKRGFVPITLEEAKELDKTTRIRYLQMGRDIDEMVRVMVRGLNTQFIGEKKT